MRGVFSACGAYRHLLFFPGRHACGWLMANPSNAGSVDGATGEVRSDPTANKVVEFSRQFGYDAPVIANAYDKVSTDPKGLWQGVPPCSPNADAYLQGLATLPLVIVAWGENPQARTRRPGNAHPARCRRRTLVPGGERRRLAQASALPALWDQAATVAGMSKGRARVLDALAEHGTNAAAAKALGMPLATVQTHVRRAYYFLGVPPGVPGEHEEARRQLLDAWAKHRAPHK